jgi:hypothetical protein
VLEERPDRRGDLLGGAEPRRQLDEVQLLGWVEEVQAEHAFRPIRGVGDSGDRQRRGVRGEHSRVVEQLVEVGEQCGLDLE